MGHIDIWVIIVFSTLVFICGMSFARSGSNMKSFFAAGIVLLHAGYNHFDTENPITGIFKTQESVIRRIMTITPDVIIRV